MVADSVAVFRRITDIHRSSTLGGALEIQGTGRIAARAVLAYVAESRRCTTLDSTRLELIRRTVIGEAIAEFGHVTETRNGAAAAGFLLPASVAPLK